MTPSRSGIYLLAGGHFYEKTQIFVFHFPLSTSQKQNMGPNITKIDRLSFLKSTPQFYFFSKAEISRFSQSKYNFSILLKTGSWKWYLIDIKSVFKWTVAMNLIVICNFFHFTLFSTLKNFSEINVPKFEWIFLFWTEICVYWTKAWKRRTRESESEIYKGTLDFICWEKATERR